MKNKNDDPLVIKKGWASLFLQILQLKNFLWFIGPAVFIFLTLYADRDKWARVFPAFKWWYRLAAVWFFILLIIYRGELITRLLIWLKERIRELCLSLLVLLATYLIIFPFDLKRTTGFLLLFAAFLAYRQFRIAPKKIQKEKKRESSVKRISMAQTVDSWVATETSNLQGVDFRELPLKGGRIKYLKFTVSPIAAPANYWRAGFKISSSNDGILPLVSSGGFLFHARHPSTVFGEGGLGLSWYIGNDPKNARHRDIKTEKTKISKGRVIIEMKVNDKNFAKCFINGTVEFKKRLDPHWLEKAFIAAWGDGNPYRIEFSEIEYQIR